MNLQSARVVTWPLVLLGCSGDPSSSVTQDGGFPSSAESTVISDQGTLRIELRTLPEQPPSHGLVSVQFALFDARTGAPRDDLSLQVLPWMPAMGHGTSVKPSVVSIGAGRYVATNVNLFMPGRWELRTTIAGARTDDPRTADRITWVLDVP